MKNELEYQKLIEEKDELRKKSLKRCIIFLCTGTLSLAILFLVGKRGFSLLTGPLMQYFAALGFLYVWRS